MIQSRSLASGDALTQPNVVLQMALAGGREAQVLANGLLKALDVLMDADSACLNFLVLAEEFDTLTFPKQRLTNTTGRSKDVCTDSRQLSNTHQRLRCDPGRSGDLDENREHIVL